MNTKALPAKITALIEFDLMCCDKLPLSQLGAIRTINDIVWLIIVYSVLFI